MTAMFFENCLYLYPWEGQESARKESDYVNEGKQETSLWNWCRFIIVF